MANNRQLFRSLTDLTRFHEKSIAFLPHTFRYNPRRTQLPWNHEASPLHRTSYTIGAFWHNLNRNSHRAGYGVLEVFVYDQLLTVADPKTLTYGQILQVPNYTLSSSGHWLRSIVGFYSAHKIGGSKRGYENPSMLAEGQLQVADFGPDTATIDGYLQQMLINPAYLPPRTDGLYKVRE